MTKKKITFTIDEAVLRFAKVGHGNFSKYIEELIKRDLFREREEAVYETVVKRLIKDGYIAERSIQSSTGEHEIIPLD